MLYTFVFSALCLSTVIFCTPWTFFKAVVTEVTAPSASRVSVDLPVIACESSDVLVSATTCPWLITTILSQIAETSERICEEKITVCFFPKPLIKLLNSLICEGSRPTVGSSRISTGGLPSNAWASPTLWG